MQGGEHGEVLRMDDNGPRGERRAVVRLFFPKRRPVPPAGALSQNATWWGGTFNVTDLEVLDAHAASHS